MSGGFNHIDVAACTQAGVALGYTPDLLTDTCAELTLALMLATARRVVETSNYVASVCGGMGDACAAVPPPPY